ncbi:MAG: hypothetical protein O7F73_04900 [Gammaproteobacteria bacterium]|nr:hypothetical protein [Gammaproteobacteria bacterium]
MRGIVRGTAKITISILLIGTVASVSARDAFPAGQRVSALFFGEIDYRKRENQGSDGFDHTQGVAQINVQLGQRFRAFTELTATKRRNTDLRSEIERLSLHYTFSDQYKLSAGRYHTPIGYWNSAFHHGSWLQTTISRPQTAKFGSFVIPIHFLGALLEGNVGNSDFGYKVGYGNGRSEQINDPGDIGDIGDGSNGDTAWLLAGSYRPLGRHRLNTGASLYRDKISPEFGPDIDEELLGVYLALEGEAPEVVLEYTYSKHESSLSEGNVNSIYGQVAYRLPGKANKFKPYFRAEHLDVDDDDPLLGALGLDYKGYTAGTRWDFSSYVVLKAEVRREEFDNSGYRNSFWLQLAFVFDATSARESAAARRAAQNRGAR